MTTVSFPLFSKLAVFFSLLNQQSIQIKYLIVIVKLNISKPLHFASKGFSTTMQNFFENRHAMCITACFWLYVYTILVWDYKVN